MLTEFVLVAAMAWASDIKTKYWERARRRAPSRARSLVSGWSTPRVLWGAPAETDPGASPASQLATPAHFVLQEVVLPPLDKKTLL